MGSCVSIHKSRAEPPLKQDMKFFVTNKDSFVVPESSIYKEKNVSVDLPSRTLHEDGDSKDDMFFDSKAWLDSDCDDDFHSVNADFTSSCGSTPVHYSTNETSLSSEDKPCLPMTEPLPPKKRLYELFRESVREQPVADESYNTTPSTSPASSSSSQRTPNAESLVDDQETSIKYSRCCLLPSLISCRITDKKKKKKKISPPVIAISGEA